MLSTPDDFLAKAQGFWTKDRERKITGGKSWLILPSQAPHLLRVLGLLRRDATMPADAVRKFSQINHMLALVEPQLKELADRHNVVRILDACCGTSYLALLAAWLLITKWGKTCEIIGIDANPKVIETSQHRAKDLGYSDQVKFTCARVAPDVWEEYYPQLFPTRGQPSPRPHALFALHACDTATDYAAATGIALKADVMALAPCCHAELARAWKDIAADDHPFAAIFRSPNLRRETAAQITDAMRLLLIRAHGYEVTATEFVPSVHTPKNRLLLCVRRGNYLREAAEQYLRLKSSLADKEITLASVLKSHPATC